MPDYMKKIQPVQVSYKDGCVFLTQPDPIGNDDAVVELTPEHVPAVVAWMQEAAESAQRNKDSE